MRIRWTLTATGDLTQISDYIETHGSGSAARGVALSIHVAIGLLAKFPMQGRAGRIANTRELVLPGLPYLVVYRVSEDEVQILRLLHGAQEWP